jgi:hypothetical protein
MQEDAALNVHVAIQRALQIHENEAEAEAEAG